jgi:hypothetical protein
VKPGFQLPIKRGLSSDTAQAISKDFAGKVLASGCFLLPTGLYALVAQKASLLGSFFCSFSCALLCSFDCSSC